MDFLKNATKALEGVSEMVDKGMKELSRNAKPEHAASLNRLKQKIALIMQDDNISFLEKNRQILELQEKFEL